MYFSIQSYFKTANSQWVPLRDCQPSKSCLQRVPPIRARFVSRGAENVYRLWNYSPGCASKTPSTPIQMLDNHALTRIFRVVRGQWVCRGNYHIVLETLCVLGVGGGGRQIKPRMDHWIWERKKKTPFMALKAMVQTLNSQRIKCQEEFWLEEHLELKNPTKRT